MTDSPSGSISLPAGYYLISVTGDNYQPNVEKIYLDSDQNISVELKPKDEVYRIYKEVDLTNPNSDDMDLNLKMKTAGGEECTVNYLNPKCPYAEYSSDIQANKKGYEVIRVNQFVNATYMVYLSKSPKY